MNTSNPKMTAQDVIEFVQLLNQNQIEVYIDGGWGVDALLGEQTRTHTDLDIAVQHKDVAQIRNLLEARGYKDVPRNDTRDCNFVLGDEHGHQIDVHSYTFDSAGNLVFGVPYPYDSLNGTGSINGHPVKCISPEWMIKFHTGYKLDENDYHDVKLLCQRFGIAMPSEYEEFERAEIPRQSELPIQQIIQYVTQLMTPGRSVLVGIDGGAGAGKTTFTRWLAESVRETTTSVSVVHIDNFYLPSAKRENHQFPLATVSDIDWTRLRDQVLAPLRSGAPARFQLYDWPADRLKDWMTIDVGGVTIIEGITSTRSELTDYYDLRVWFSCPRDIRISRLLGRGDTSAREIEHWMPSEDIYIALQSPEETAHLVVDSTADMMAKDENRWYATRWLPPNTA